MASYDPTNVFAKILRGEVPSYKVFEDDHAFAFLDIMPRAPGHTLVIPKAPARNILDVAPDDLAHVMKVVQKVARAGMSEAIEVGSPMWRRKVPISTTSSSPFLNSPTSPLAAKGRRRRTS